MPTIEYTTIDKSTWGPGPWQNEPDKIQYTDEETGYPCLIKRVDHSGHLCGYVGVDPTHPFHGKGYDYVNLTTTWRKRRVSISSLAAHGGITFTNSCEDMTEAAWRKHKKNYINLEAEAKRFPLGDAANFRRKWASAIDNYQTWKDQAQKEFICHIPEPGTTDNIWWFGFDCAHGDDVQPALESLGLPLIRNRTYRDVNYVKENIRHLAKQLKRAEEENKENDGDTNHA